MTKHTIVGLVLLTILMIGIGAPAANAQGFHLSGGGLHVDLGYPHASHGYYSGWSHWGSRRAVVRGHRDWHDTTHYDFHPGQRVRHYGHVDYVPGHFDVHSSGHWHAHF